MATGLTNVVHAATAGSAKRLVYRHWPPENRVQSQSDADEPEACLDDASP